MDFNQGSNFYQIPVCFVGVQTAHLQNNGIGIPALNKEQGKSFISL